VSPTTGSSSDTAGGSVDLGSRIRPRLLTQRKILNPDMRLLRPLSIRVLSNELPVSVDGVGAAGTLPIPVFTKLGNAGAGLRYELAVGMPLYELTVAVDAVGGLRGAPILLLTTAAGCHQQQTDTNCSTSCPDCDHRQHLPLAATGYCNDARTLCGLHR
jgi:hypothetical protein